MLDARLRNGLRVIVAPWRAAPVVSTQLWVEVGSADEQPGEAGLAHLHEHMIFKGTARRGVGAVAREVESAGGEINAYTSLDHTVYHATLSSRHLDVALDVLGDAVFHSAFDTEEIAREIDVVIEELLRGHDTPARVVGEMLFRQLFRDHPYGRPVIGTRETIEAFDRDAVLRFFRRWYRPSNCCLVVAGDVDPDAVWPRIDATFGSIDDEPIARLPRPVEPEMKRSRSEVVRQPIQESHLMVGWHGPSLESPDTPAIDLLSIVLGAGESSRLYRALKRRRELVNDAFAYAHTPKDPGLVGAGAIVQGSGVQVALEGLLGECLHLADATPRPDELEKAKTIILSEQVYQKETVDGWGRKLGYFATTVGSPEFEDRYYEAIRHVTAQQVREVAERYLSPDRAAVAALLPETVAPDFDPDLAVDRVRKSRRRRSSRPAPGVRGVTRASLSNGCRVLVQEDHTLPRVAVRSAALGGLLSESEDEAGVSHLASQVLTRGTRSFGADQIVELCDAMAAGLGGISGRSSMGLAADFLLEHWDAGFELFTSCLLEPVFEPEEVDRERRTQLEDIIARADSPSAVAFDEFSRALYDVHPYGRSIIGNEATVRSVTSDAVARAYWRQVTPSRLVVAIVGAVDTGRILDRLEATLGVFGEVTPPFELPPRPHPMTERRDRTLTMKREQAHIVLGAPGVALDDPRRHALDILATALGGQSGRLFLELRDRRSLAYSVSAMHLDGFHPGAFAAYIATRPDRAEEAELALRDELSSAGERLSEEEMHRAKQYLVGSHEIGLQRATARASAMALMEAYGRGYDEPFSYADRVEAVTVDEVREVARELSDTSGWVTARVLPESSRAAPKRSPGAKVRS